jgi:hypothetical protein
VECVHFFQIWVVLANVSAGDEPNYQGCNNKSKALSNTLPPVLDQNNKAQHRMKRYLNEAL